MRMPSHSRRSVILAALAALPLAACSDCETLGDTSPQGLIEPPVLDLGPVTLGTTCEAVFSVRNVGGSELEVTTANLEDSSGDFILATIPNFVGIQGAADVPVAYTASGALGRQSATLVLATNDPDNGGKLTATVTAIAAEEAAGVAKAYCPDVDDNGDDAFLECPDAFNFGAVNIAQDPNIPILERIGLTKSFLLRNEGNAPLSVQAVLFNDGNGDFAVTGLRRNNILIPDFPIELEAGAGECGVQNPDAKNELIIDVIYSPTALGADSDTLLILTDALEGSTVEVPVSGVGSDVGILLTPPTVAFGSVPEGNSGDVDVLVSNLGSGQASINNTCIDVDGDEECDANCNGTETALDGALSCKAYQADGTTAEARYFILEPTDAQVGGADERIIRVTWSPVAGNTTIPGTATLRVESAILDDRVYSARIVGGTVGNLAASSDESCGNNICIPAEGDAGDVGTWTGAASVTLSNPGEASVDVTLIEWEGPPTIADDYALTLDGEDVDLENPGITLAPGASITLDIDYANNDASGADYINLVFTHTGLDGILTLPLQVTPPPAM